MVFSQIHTRFSNNIDVGTLTKKSTRNHTKYTYAIKLIGQNMGKKLHGKKSSAAFSASAFQVTYLKFLEWGTMHRKEMVTN